MFLQPKSHQDLIEVLDSEQLFNPFLKQFLGRSHWGEEIQDPEMYAKAEMAFPSGEPLPRCWLEPNYRFSQVSVR